MNIYLEQLYCFNVILNVIFQYFAVLRLGLGLGFDKLSPARLFCANTGREQSVNSAKAKFLAYLAVFTDRRPK